MSAFVLLVVAACGGDDSNGANAAGTERGACYPNGTCNAGLTCASDVCVSLVPDASSGDDAGDASSADGATPTDASDAATRCTSYVKSTIAAMRAAGAAGCFELDAVSLGVTASATSPRLFAQDPAGGDYSAMMLRCSANDAAHPCAVAAAVSSIADGHAVTAKGAFARASNGLDLFYLDAITDGAPATVPSPVTVSTADLMRGAAATSARLSYQAVVVDLAENLVMYDWTPAEFVVPGATQCPYVLGFAMVDQTDLTSAPSGHCTSGSAQPAGVAADAGPVAKEILVGTDFSTGFAVTTDCRCAKAEYGAAAVVPTVTSDIAQPGPLRALLVIDGAATPYVYIAPKTISDAHVTSLVAGQ